MEETKQLTSESYKDSFEEIKTWITTLVNSKKFYSEIRNRWFNISFGEATLKVYLRVSIRSNISKSKMLDISACEVEAAHRGNGYFTKFLNDLEEICVQHVDISSGNVLPIYVENVLTKGFQNFFEKRGYKKITSPHRSECEDICFFRE